MVMARSNLILRTFSIIAGNEQACFNNNLYTSHDTSNFIKGTHEVDFWEL